MNIKLLNTFVTKIGWMNKFKSLNYNFYKGYKLYISTFKFKNSTLITQNKKLILLFEKKFNEQLDFFKIAEKTMSFSEKKNCLNDNLLSLSDTLFGFFKKGYYLNFNLKSNISDVYFITSEMELRTHIFISLTSEEKKFVDTKIKYIISLLNKSLMLNSDNIRSIILKESIQIDFPHTFNELNNSFDKLTKE